MKNYVTLVRRVEGVGVERVETQDGATKVAWGPGARRLSITRWFHDMPLPEGVLGEMQRQAAAIFAEGTRA